MAFSFSTKKRPAPFGPSLNEAEREEILAVLMETHQFDLERLAAWLDSLRSADFWTDPDADDQICYTPQAANYLVTVFQPNNEESYADYMRRASRLLWEARSKQSASDPELYGIKFHPAMDGALLILAGQLQDLKALAYFSEEGCRCAPENVREMASAVIQRDSTPDLQDFCYGWLSLHFRVYAGQYWEELSRGAR